MVGELLEQADGGAIALGGGSILSERVREALARHTVVWLQIEPRAGLAPDRRQRPPAGDQRRGRRAADGRAPAAVRAAGGRGGAGGRPRRRLAGAAGDPGARRASRRDQAAVGDERLRRVPGPGRPRPARFRVVAAGGGALLRQRSRRRPALRGAAGAARGRRRGRAGGDGEVDGRGRAGGKRAGPGGDDPRRPPDRPRRRRRRRSRGLLRPPLPARGGVGAGANHAGRPGRFGLRRQDRRRSPGGQELRRRLPPAGGGGRRHRDARHAWRGRSWRPASSRC